VSLRPAVNYYQPRGNRLTVAPASEPVTADELRTHLRTDSTNLPDDEANDYIAEARQEIEDQTGVAMVNQTWRLSLDQWPMQREPWWDGVRQAHINVLHGGYADLELPRWPLSSITSVTVYDEASTSTAVTVADIFDVDTYSIPGRMGLQSGAVWPVALRPTNAIEVVYVSGYGADGDSVPAPIKRAVKVMASHIYAKRGDGCSASDAYQDSGARGIMGRYQPMKV
jgi:hypothetical protein